MDNSSFAEETHNPFYNVWLFLHLVGDSFQKVMQSCPLTFLAYTNSQKHCDYIFQNFSLQSRIVFADRIENITNKFIILGWE